MLDDQRQRLSAGAFEAGKTCKICNETKPETSFHRHGSGRKSMCRDCRSRTRTGRQETPEQRLARWLWQEYGLTVEQYQTLLRAQGGACAMCGAVPATGKRLAVDHCHATGVIRALLCMTCNVGVGFYEKHHVAASEYLATYGAGNPLLRK